MEIKILLANPERFRPEAEYVFRTFFDIIGAGITFVDAAEQAGRQDLLICYGKDAAAECGKIVIPQSPWDEWERAAPRVKFAGDVPVVTTENFTAAQVVREDNGGNCRRFTFDIIAAAFYFLSRQEERTNKKRDAWDCFPEQYSLSHQWGITQLPLVNVYVNLLEEQIISLSGRMGEEIKLYPRWKDKKRFAAALTHDVDNLRKYSLAGGLKLLLKKILLNEGSFKHAYRILKAAALKQKDPYWSFEDFMLLESRFGYKSTFYILSASSHRRYDPRYRLDKRLTRRLRDITEKGWEIGLHGSYDSFEDGDMLKMQKDRLEKVLGKTVSGIRQHYLRFSIERTFQAQADAGFLYDTTLGYNENIGFRAGIAMPFFPFDKDRKTSFPLLELPLAVMDGSLFEFQRYSPAEAWAKIKKMIEQVEQARGLLVILWHTKAKDEQSCPGWWQVYAQMLEYLSLRQAWVGSAAEICRWWMERKDNVRDSRYI